MTCFHYTVNIGHTLSVKQRQKAIPLVCIAAQKYFRKVNFAEFMNQKIKDDADEQDFNVGADEQDNRVQRGKSP